MTKKQIAIAASALLLFALVSTAVFLPHQKFQFERFFNRAFYSLQSGLSLILPSGPYFSLSIPLRKQEHSVTCEVASLRMALHYYGINITEDELITELEFSTYDPISHDRVWGDPDKGFVGDINGSIFDGTGYGVYAWPITKLAMKYRSAEMVENASLDRILKEVRAGRPVIVWGLLTQRTPIYWQTEDGKTVKAFAGEHARVLAGFTGSIGNPDSLILMDPIYGKIKMSKERFLTDWAVLDNRAVVVF